MDSDKPPVPVTRSFLLVLLGNMLTFGIYGLYYLYQMFKVADQARDTPFMTKTFWAIPILALAASLSVLLFGMPGLETTYGPWNPLPSAPEGGGIVQITQGPLSDTAWATNLTELFIVAGYLCLAAFLFMEIARFHPKIVSPVALPVLLLLQLPAIFVPELVWGALLINLLGLFAWHDLHRGLLEFYDGVPEEPGGHPVHAAEA